MSVNQSGLRQSPPKSGDRRDPVSSVTEYTFDLLSRSLETTQYNVNFCKKSHKTTYITNPTERYLLNCSLRSSLHK